MTHSVENQIAVITGGSTGIGLATAKALIDSGAARVYITGRTESTLKAAEAQLGPKAVAVQADTARPEEIRALKARIEANGESLDTIFINAGVAEYNSFGATTEAEFDKTFGINVRGAFFTAQTLLPLVRDGGAIIFNASVVSNKGMAGLSLYNASKAAVRSFARTLANDLKSRKIRVNAVSPGATETPIMDHGLKLDAQSKAGFAAYVSDQAPAGRMGQPEEIAAAVLFLASPAAAYINGIELSVDGGLAQV